MKPAQNGCMIGVSSLCKKRELEVCMISFLDGDMFETPADIRVNTVNCVGVMGAGVALAFKKLLPEMFKDYKKACDAGLVRPGKLHVWRSLTGDWVVNFPTKRDWRDPSRYEDIDTGLDALYEFLAPLGSVTVTIPALGCGHGGLDWGRVSQMIREKLSDLPANLLVFSPSESRRVGTATAGEDESLEVKRAGYTASSFASFSNKTGSTIYAKGDLGALNEPWISVFPSRNPSMREMSALESISSELSRKGDGITVALIYNNRSSEDVARVFLDRGMNVVMILPFGVLTRKKIAVEAGGDCSGSITLISAVAPGEKWSRFTLAGATDILSGNSSAALLSDPEVGWVLKRSNSDWRQLAKFFIRYNVMSNESRSLLAEANAFAIGRRSTDGAPNVENLLSAYRGEPVFSDGRKDGCADVDSTESLGVGKELVSLTVDLDKYPFELWVKILESVRYSGAQGLVLKVDVEDEGAAKSLREIISLIKH